MNKSNKLYEVRPFESIKKMIVECSELYGEKNAFLVKSKKAGDYFGISYKKLKEDVEALGTKLCKMGLYGEKIAIIGNNCYQWVVAYLTIVGGLGVAVPLDKELNKEEVHNLIDTAGCKAIFFTENYSSYFEDYDIDYKFNMDIYEFDNKEFSDKHIRSLIEEGKNIINSKQEGYLYYVNKTIDANEMALLLFTSGTTGNPKGVMLSNTNVGAVIRGTSQIYTLKGNGVSLSVLPIHHTFESVIGILTLLFQGGCIAFYEGLKYVLKNLQESKADMIIGVPLIIESIYSKIWKEAEKTGKDKLLKKVVKVNKFLKSIGIDKSDVLFKSVKKKFGGNFKCVISGAAAINPNVLRGFMDLGFHVTQGYGLTETSPLVSGVPDFENGYKKAGSCGPAMPGVQIKINNPDNDGIGEILVKGDNVMLGYYNMPEETEKVLKDGWFYTGDLGFLDKDGWLYITGREKNVIVTKTGKNIYPEEIEILISDNKYVTDSMVYGQKEENGEEYYVAVQIQPDRELMLEEKGEMNEDEIFDFFKEWIHQINEKLPSYKRIKKVEIRKEDFIRTTTKKIKRQANIPQ